MKPTSQCNGSIVRAGPGHVFGSGGYILPIAVALTLPGGILLALDGCPPTVIVLRFREVSDGVLGSGVFSGAGLGLEILYFLGMFFASERYRCAVRDPIPWFQ